MNISLKVTVNDPLELGMSTITNMLVVQNFEVMSDILWVVGTCTKGNYAHITDHCII